MSGVSALGRKQTRILGAAILASLPFLAKAEGVVVGAIYCFEGTGTPNKVILSKVLDADATVVHTRQYSNAFAACPASIDTSMLTWTVPDVPIRATAFEELNPVLVVRAAVTAEEAASVREMTEVLHGPRK